MKSGGLVEGISFLDVKPVARWCASMMMGTM